MQCLLLHGIGGSPFEMTPLAEALSASGFMAHAPALPGHNSTEAAYLASSFAQWRAFASAEYARLSEQGPVLLIGYSLGGILALDVAQAAARGDLPPPAGLLCLAAPLFLRHFFPFFAPDWRFFLLPLWARLRPVLRVPPRSAASRAIAPWQGHEGLCCLRHFAQIERALPAIRRGLSLIRAPLCVIQLRSDTSCPPYNAHYLLRHCASPWARLHLLRVRSPHGGHLPMTHAESRQQVAQLSVAFARDCAVAAKTCKFML